MAEMAEANEQIQDRAVPGDAQQRMQRLERKLAGHRDRDRRAQRKQRSERALLLATGIEATLQKSCISDKKLLHAVAPSKRTPLLEPERNQNREEIHGSWVFE